MEGFRHDADFLSYKPYGHSLNSKKLLEISFARPREVTYWGDTAERDPRTYLLNEDKNSNKGNNRLNCTRLPQFYTCATNTVHYGVTFFSVA
ncbi:hypothetical protein VTN49DRAFT_3232 [Thermomyces lanuginosus]|uniref:uncharacterized protein n=1 Tax=Thermomyces lanuginosus TaxID=5541 RepID=UPI0037437200